MGLEAALQLLRQRVDWGAEASAVLCGIDSIDKEQHMDSRKVSQKVRGSTISAATRHTEASHTLCVTTPCSPYMSHHQPLVCSWLRSASLNCRTFRLYVLSLDAVVTAPYWPLTTTTSAALQFVLLLPLLLLMLVAALQLLSLLLVVLAGTRIPLR
jgi:hypothetical protein